MCKRLLFIMLLLSCKEIVKEHIPLALNKKIQKNTALFGLS
ncbi:hypothetical protein P1059_01747 [Pasteurella multocida subsp. gallicida P1059]|nr:hypothetical protein NT08PM_1912 [Pasteurella multocida subsp. multocida str. 3480]AHE65219.1 hypothetical protein PMCN03_1788 [Pasteurella multocida subsp. multocida str. HB03]EJZ77948.1 hypothetical protein P1059_01747 [Pasteurella multocida subsp. gallicida P1059]